MRPEIRADIVALEPGYPYLRLPLPALQSTGSPSAAGSAGMSSLCALMSTIDAIRANEIASDVERD